MIYLVDVAGTRVRVELTSNGVFVDGQRIDVSMRPVDGGARHDLRIGGEVHRVVARAGEGRGQFRVEVDGIRLDAEALDEHARAVQALTSVVSRPSGPVPLKAPMPGLIVRIAVKPGDAVVTGQGLVVMEAMKMENELRATAAGVVREVHAVVGAAVEKGALLVELTAAS
jgi:biotin carboxyl carrier protein